MNVEVMPVSQLGPGELTRWSELQRASAVYRSPFFRPEFATAVAHVREVSVAVIEDAGSVAGFFPFEVVRRRRGRSLGWPFSDYHGVVLDPDAVVDPRELVRACGLTVWSFDHLPAQLTAFDPHVLARGRSPYLDLSEGLEAYLADGRRRSDVRDTLRKARKLAREVGPLRFVSESDAPELLAQTIEWKRRQNDETGVRDVLADSRSRELLRHIHAARGTDFAGMLSVLYAGDVVASLHFGLRSASVWHYWFPAYNRDLSRYSPGLVLLLQLAEAAPPLGVHEIDLGRGEARYKQAFATGSVSLHEGCVGAQALDTVRPKVQALARRALRAAGAASARRAVRRAVRRAR